MREMVCGTTASATKSLSGNTRVSDEALNEGAAIASITLANTLPFLLRSPYSGLLTRDARAWGLEEVRMIYNLPCLLGYKACLE
jgi:hypothetical protein